MVTDPLKCIKLLHFRSIYAFDFKCIVILYYYVIFFILSKILLLFVNIQLCHVPKCEMPFSFRLYIQWWFEKCLQEHNWESLFR